MSNWEYDERTIRFLITGDLHYRALNPRGRIDNFEESLTKKVLEVFSIAKETRCIGIIIPGDITGSPELSLSTIINLYKLLKQSHSFIFTIAGNHDEHDSDPSTLDERTAYGLLRHLKAIRQLWCNAAIPIMFQGQYGTRHFLRITGCDYSANTDRDISEYCPTPPDPYRNRNEYWWVHVVHGMLLERPPSFDMPRYTLMEDVAKHPNAPDVVICGHEHIGFGIKKVNNTLFINPGALCRIYATPAEMQRKVQVALMEISSESINARLIPLKSARPGEEVLSREHIEAKIEADKERMNFLSLLSAKRNAQYLSVEEIVEGIAQHEDLPQEIVEEALRRIQEADTKILK